MLNNSSPDECTAFEKRMLNAIKTARALKDKLVTQGIDASLQNHRVQIAWICYQAALVYTFDTAGIQTATHKKALTLSKFYNHFCQLTSEEHSKLLDDVLADGMTPKNLMQIYIYGLSLDFYFEYFEDGHGIDFWKIINLSIGKDIKSYHSDPKLIEKFLRTFISNANKYDI